MTPEYRIDAEKRITDYLSRNSVGAIRYIQVEQTFTDLGVEIHVWNVRADDGNWWVVEGENAPMNLYTQREFYFSADEAYSFHMGITQRLHASHQKQFKHVIDELPLDIDWVKSISRRLNNAAQSLNQITGAEDIQAIGLTCRESLIELAAILAEANPGLLEKEGLKAADFKGIAHAVIAIYAEGKRNKTLRAHGRNMADMAWDYACEIVHSPNRNVPDAKICLLFACTIVSIFQSLFLKHLGYDAEEKCPECKSMDIEFHSTEEHTLTLHCNDCGHESLIDLEEHQDDGEPASGLDGGNDMPKS